MNRGYSFTARGQARSPPRRDRLQRQDLRGTSSSKNQAAVKQDLNIDDFGDMGSDDDDFQSLGSNFFPPKPPAKPQYNLVPYGFLRDDDELVEEDYDGVPIDDTALGDSPKKQLWQSSPQKSQPEEIRGAPITVLDSSNWLDSKLTNMPKNTTSQDNVPRNRPGLGSSIDSNINKIGDNNPQLGIGRWDKEYPATNTNLGNHRNIPPWLDVNVGEGKPLSFVRAQNAANNFIQPGNKRTSSLSFVRGDDGRNPVLKTSSRPTGNNTNFIRNIDDSNPFLKMGNKQSSSGKIASFVSAKDDSNTVLQPRESKSRWDDKPKPAWADKGRDSSERLKAQVQPIQNQMFIPTTIASTSAQLELLQAAALQQALVEVTQLSSQSGLNLLGAQNLLVQATQNPTLAAALVNTGIRSIHPNTLNNPALEALLKSAVTTAPDMTQSSSSLLGYPLLANTVVNSGSMPRKRSIPDGSGATRYPAPDVSSLVFDPSTGYRFDASTGLHYDANSGYFFNSELKVFLQWDKFTQTYLKVDNPPGVPRFSNSSADRMSYMAGSPLTPQNKGQLPSRFSNVFPIEIHHGLAPSNNARSGSGLAPLSNTPPSRGLAPTMNAPTSSTRKDNNSVPSSISTIPTDFSKPPPPLSHSFSDSRFQPIGTNLSSVAEQKAAALPNFAETSLFNKLRKAKLAQTAHTKSDRQRWGSPDPLLEAAQKHAAETNNLQDGLLNMKEILQRSRQFMKQKTGNADDESIDVQKQKESSRSQSGEQRKLRSRSRSAGRPLRRSRSPERPANRRGRSSISPQQRRKPNSRGRSPNVRLRGKPSVSPTRKMSSVSRSRSPNNRAREKAILSPEARSKRSASRGRSPTNRERGHSVELRKRRPASKGRSPLRRTGKSSKSPVSRHRRPISKGRSPKRRPRGRPSISPELKKRIYQSRTPNRSLSPKVKVVLDQSPGGSKIRVRSSEVSNKRSADRELNAEKRKLRRKLSPSPERARAVSPGRKNMKDPVQEKIGLAGRIPVKSRLGPRDDKRGSLEKDNVTELKPIPYDNPQSSSKKSSGKGKDVSGYKSLSNLRNQGKDKPREKETDEKQDNSQQNEDKYVTGKLSAALDLTADSDDDDRRSRANHRLVSERTFSSGWKGKKPCPVPMLSPTKKPDTNSKSESCLLAKDTKEKIEVDTNKEDNEGEKQTEDSNEFDFLNDTLDDDKESTVIDEYEEILDYEYLEGTSELLVKKSTSNVTNSDIERVKKSHSKESLGSPVIDLCIDPEERAIEASMCAESNLESKQCSSVEDNELVNIPSEKSDSLGYGAVVAQGEGDADVLKGVEVVDEDIDGIELHVLEDLDIVGESAGESDRASDPQSVVDNNSLGTNEIKEPDTCAVEICEKDGSREADNNSLGTNEIKEPDACEVEICEKDGSREADDVPPVLGDTPKGRPETEDDVKKSNAVGEATTEPKDEPHNTIVSKSNEATTDPKDEPHNTIVSKSDEHSPGPDILENEEWNVVDSVDVQDELTKVTVPSGVNESSNKKQEDMVKHGLDETDASSSKPQNLEEQKMKDDDSGVTQNAAAAESKDDGNTGELDTQGKMNEPSQQFSKDDAKNKEHDSQVTKGVSHNDEPDAQVSTGDGRSNNPHLQDSNDVDAGKGKNSQTETEEPLVQVRSVSDIEKFLLLSSQEVEAKREQGVDPTASKNDKKSGVFSRLGEKLPSDEAGGEPTVVLEILSETSVSAPDPSSKLSASSTKPPQPATKAKPTAALKTLNKSKIADPEDPVGILFSDKPSPQILIGPMNFIEPLQNFQQFTQRYMVRFLEQEKVSFKKILVCHEDATGAPYHYIIVIFHSAQEASNWFKKHKGRFKADEKLFKKVAGHLKHKFIPSSEAFLHFTRFNWFCKVCKKVNFPPRSLCFNCFHHKDPGGFSPLTILDKTPPPYKTTNFVGAPKLKFFVTKEKVIESAPSLDGFDITSIEMIMDEKMGFPAGICVFELPDYISAGRFKNYLNRRGVEAVSVQMHEKPTSISTGPRIAPPSSPRFPSQDVQVPMGLVPTPPRDVRVPRGRSPSPVRDVRVPRGRSPSPVRDVRVPRGRVPSPSRDLRFVRGRSPSPFRQRHSRERVLSRSPRRHSPGYQPRTRSPRRDVYEEMRYTSPESRSLRDIPLRGRPIRESSPRATRGEHRRLRSRERVPGYRSPVPYSSPGYQSPHRYRSRSPVYDPLRRRSPSPRYRSPSPVCPTKPDGRGDWRYPPPDPTNFRFEPKSGLDYDPTTTLYYEPKSCCFYNDETNEWLEYNPRTGRYNLAR